MIAVDTSVAVPLLLKDHSDHDAVVRWWRGRDIALSGHALAETYSVMTRMPGAARLAPDDAARLIAQRFPMPVVLASDTAAALPTILADLGIAGGAVYDGMVALAAAQEGHVLATRDARAKLTYDAVGIAVEVVQ
jgi:predicted nucleic acid-binding protein